MPGFFDNFPSIYYTLDDPALLKFKQVVNIFARTAMLQNVLQNVNLFYQYYIREGETPEIIAAKYYNDPTTHWIILYTNQILDPYYQWPLDDNELTELLVNNYGSVANAETTMDHIEKHTNVTITENYQSNTNTYVSILANNVVSIDGYSNFPTEENPIVQLGGNNVVKIGNTTIDTSSQLYWISAYQQAVNVNESNRNISIIKSDYVAQIVTEFENLMSS